MSARVSRAEFESSNGERVLTVVTENTGFGGPARSPKPSDYPSDLVAAVRDWADAGLQGLHEDYRVPSRLVAYLNEVVAADGTSPRGIVAHTVLEMLNLAPEGGS